MEADLYARVQELKIAQEARDIAARRLSSLAEVALQLTTAETVEDLERIVVSRGLAVLGADGGGIISPDDRGGWRATLSDALGEHARLLYGNVPYDSPLPAPWVARTGREKLLPTRESGLAFDASMAGVYADLGRFGWAFLPLTVSDVCVGSLAVAWTEEHPFGSDELELMRVFAAQCAQVLMRIRATAAQRAAAVAAQKMSETLQRSLLSQPPITRIAADRRALPARVPGSPRRRGLARRLRDDVRRHHAGRRRRRPATTGRRRRRWASSATCCAAWPTTATTVRRRCSAGSTTP